MIFVLRQIQEKCREQNMGLYSAFVHQTKAFDTVSRDKLRKILARLGCPPKLLIILRQLHKGQQGQDKHNGSLSGNFPISNGLEQGCVLAPTLFSIFFSIMLREAKEDLQTAFTSVSEQTAVSSTFGVSSHARKPSRNSSLSRCLLTTAPFSSTHSKPCSTSSTASLTHPRTSASSLARRRLRCCTNPLHVRHTVLLKPASLTPT